MRKAATVLALVVATASGTVSCASHGTGDSDGRHLSIRTDVFYTGAVLPLVVGVQKHIYAKRGLSVDLNPGKGSATTIQTVAAGSDDIGYADAGTLVQAAGRGVPVEMIAGMVQRSPLAVFARASSGIRSASDLAGKSAGFTAGSAPELLFPAFAKATGLDKGSVHLLQTNIPTRDSMFLQGRAQFTFGLLNVTEPNLESKCHCTLTALDYADAGIHALSSGLITSRSFADKHAKALRTFLAATADAVRYVDAHLDDAVSAFFRFDRNSTLSRPVVKAQWRASARLLHSTNTAGAGFGCMADADWASTITLMERYAKVPQGKVTPRTVASNAFLPGGCSTG